MPLAARMKRGSVLLAILYAASALMPAVHEVLHSFQGACEACLPAAADGPVPLAACDGPCGDPTHHHHPLHHRQHCVTCQWGYAFHSLAPASLSAGSGTSPETLAPAGSQQPTSAADVRIAAARAPPVVPIL